MLTRLLSVVILLGVCLTARPVHAANYALEIIHPHASDTSVARHTKNYPGIEYNIRAGVIGGLYPYTFELTTAPAGMTISANGTITWADPLTAGSPHNVTMRVTDSEGTQVSRSWTITVSTANTLFLDSVSGNNANPGTLASPKRDLEAFCVGKNTTTFPEYHVYFRAGTYTTETCSYDLTGDGDHRIILLASRKPTVWLAYPGDARPIIDFNGAGALGSGYFQLDDAYIDGLGFTDSGNHFFRGVSPYAVLRRNTFYDLRTAAGGGSNYSMIMSISTGAGAPHGNTVIQDNEFYDGVSNSGVSLAALKIYSLTKALIEDNLIRNFSGSSIEGLALKADITNSAARGNTIRNISDRALNGNMNNLGNTEISYNRLYNNGSTRDMYLNQDNTIITPVYLFRNTVVGRILVNGAHATTGPLNFADNVIVNEQSGTPPGSKIEHGPNVTNPERIVIYADPNGNLVGNAAAGIVDSVGALQGSYRTTYLGLKGYELAEGAPPDVPPSAPTNLQVVDTPGDVNGRQLNLTWSPSGSPGVTAQRVYRTQTSGANYALVQTFNDNTTTTHTDGGLTNGELYYYVLRAYNGTTALESANSNESSAVPLVNPIPPTSTVGRTGGGGGQQ